MIRLPLLYTKDDFHSDSVLIPLVACYARMQSNDELTFPIYYARVHLFFQLHLHCIVLESTSAIHFHSITLGLSRLRPVA